MYNYELTKEDYVAFNRYFASKNPRARRNALINRIMGPVCFAIVFGFSAVTSGFNLVLLITYLVVGVLWVLFYPKYQNLRLDRQVNFYFMNENNKKGLGKKQFEFEEATFSQKSEHFTDRVNYVDIKSFQTDKNHFYIYTGEMSAFIIPFSAFSSDTEKEGFVQMIKSILPQEKIIN